MSWGRGLKILGGGLCAMSWDGESWDVKTPSSTSSCAVLDLVMSDSLQPHGLYRPRLLCSWDSPGKNSGVGCHFLLRGIFPAQELNPHLLHRRLLHPWDFPGKNSGVGCHFLLQWIIPGMEPRPPTLQADSLPSEPPGNPSVHSGNID